MTSALFSVGSALVLPYMLPMATWICHSHVHGNTKTIQSIIEVLQLQYSLITSILFSITTDTTYSPDIHRVILQCSGVLVMHIHLGADGSAFCPGCIQEMRDV